MKFGGSHVCHDDETGVRASLACVTQGLLAKTPYLKLYPIALDLDHVYITAFIYM